MQYVRNLSDSVSTAWNSINPATLSGAIDVIVVEQEDGSFACSPFHVRFGKFSLLRPSDKKVEFTVNGIKQDYSMKLGEGGEAFFVFETTDNIPKSMQTSPLVSPAQSPTLDPEEGGEQGQLLQEPDMLQLDKELSKPHRPPPSVLHGQPDSTHENGILTPLSTSPNFSNGRPVSGDWSNSIQRPHSDDILRRTARATSAGPLEQFSDDDEETPQEKRERSMSPPPLAPKEAVERAHIISKALLAANIPSDINDTGDIMLDMTSFKSSEDDMLRAEIVARKILSEKLDGNYDIGALFGFDAEGNLWIYSSEEARQAAMKKTMEASLPHHHPRRSSIAADAASDPGYHSDSSDATAAPTLTHGHRRAESDSGPMNMQTPPHTPTGASTGEPNRNYAKTLRLTSEQLKDLDLMPGENSMSFTVNRATCTAKMYRWKHETPVVISDIDGTITKSDALGHVLNMIGRDWTHSGVAKLYTDIAQNGYNIMYLTSRSVGQADTTRQYLYNIVQDGYRLPHGPTILSPDRTMAALRREIYLRKPHVFKMATLRDIRNLYGPDRTPFTAGFGNRLTDQISYRTVDVPRNRIFTINSNAEVSLDLLSLNKLKMSYVNINEVVDHYFPPVNTLVKGGGEEYTDFKYWRDEPLDLDAFSASGSDDDGEDDAEDGDDADDDEDDDDVGDDQYSDNDEDADDALADSYISRDSFQDAEENSILTDSAILDAQQRPVALRQQSVYYDEDDEDETGLASDDEIAAYEEGFTPSRNSTEMKAKRRSNQRTDVVEDAAAEIITGVGHLSFGKDVPQ